MMPATTPAQDERALAAPTADLLSLRGFLVSLLRWASVQAAGNNNSRIALESAAREADQRFWEALMGKLIPTGIFDNPELGDAMDRLTANAVQRVVQFPHLAEQIASYLAVSLAATEESRAAAVMLAFMPGMPIHMPGPTHAIGAAHKRTQDAEDAAPVVRDSDRRDLPDEGVYGGPLSAETVNAIGFELTSCPAPIFPPGLGRLLNPWGRPVTPEFVLRKVRGLYNFTGDEDVDEQMARIFRAAGWVPAGDPGHWDVAPPDDGTDPRLANSLLPGLTPGPRMSFGFTVGPHAIGDADRRVREYIRQAPTRVSTDAVGAVQAGDTKAAQSIEIGEISATKADEATSARFFGKTPDAPVVTAADDSLEVVGQRLANVVVGSLAYLRAATDPRGLVLLGGEDRARCKAGATAIRNFGPPFAVLKDRIGSLPRFLDALAEGKPPVPDAEQKMIDALAGGDGHPRPGAVLADTWKGIPWQSASVLPDGQVALVMPRRGGGGGNASFLLIGYERTRPSLGEPLPAIHLRVSSGPWKLQTPSLADADEIEVRPGTLVRFLPPAILGADATVSATIASPILLPDGPTSAPLHRWGFRLLGVIVPELAVLGLERAVTDCMSARQEIGLAIAMATKAYRALGGV